MRVEPSAFSADDVAAHVVAHYDQAVDRLEFVPRGDVGWSWVVHRGPAADPLFVKVYDGAGPPERMASVRRGLRLLEVLRTERILDNVAQPIGSPETGELDTALGGDRPFRVSLQSFLPGEPQGGHQLTPAVGASLGRTAARLHRATPELFRALGLAPGDTGHAAWSAAEMLESRRAEVIDVAGDQAGDAIDAALVRIRDLEQREQSAGPVPVVLVHGDMVADNVLVSGGGSTADDATSGSEGPVVSVVDWDDVRPAPAEVELSLLAWLAVDAFPAVADAYREEASGEPWVPLDPGRLELQTWRYTVGSVAYYLGRLADPDLAPEQAESDRGLLGWCVQEWSVIPDKFAAAGNTALFQA